MKKKNSKASKKASTMDLESLENAMKPSTPSEKTGTHLWNAPDAVAYAEEKLEIKLDDWQKEYIAHKGNTVVRAGRQSGKSFANLIFFGAEVREAVSLSLRMVVIIGPRSPGIPAYPRVSSARLR